ncbi:MAG TPA: hypothetical protein VJ652_19125 [Noviherbaspirillum sp.]|nr:hypothetical protein [Noviherbaspirillum sp.]
MSTPSDDSMQSIKKRKDGIVRGLPADFLPAAGAAQIEEGLDIADRLKIEIDAAKAAIERSWLEKKAAPFKEGVHAAKVAATPGAVALSGLAAQWNAGIDMLYYDVQALTPQEFVKLSGMLLSQGTVLIVRPRRDDADGVDVINGNDFVTHQRTGKSSTDTLVVPGVGSTSIAAASLARNVADTLSKPVAAIVPGYGAADLLADACGGWFVLGANNSLLETAAKVNAMGFKKSAGTSEAAGEATVGGAEILGNYWPSPMGLLLNETNEADVLQDLFSAENNLKLLVGHSKGCLALAFALNAVAARNVTNITRDLQVVTIGCVTYFSKIKTTHLHQFLGSLDVLGVSNSRHDLAYTCLAGKTHSLNSRLPTSVRVADVLHLAKVV